MRPTDLLAVRRVAAELRGMLGEAPSDDPDVKGLLADAEALDRVVDSFKNAISLNPPGSIPANGGLCPKCGGTKPLFCKCGATDEGTD